MMTESKLVNWDQLILPINLVSKSDLVRLILELETLSNALVDGNARQRTGIQVDSKYMISNQMRDLVEVNNIDLSKLPSRDNLLKQLRILKKQAPVVNITLAARVGGGDLAKLIQWFRQEVHRQTILVIGLQPDLIGGIYIRTPNHIYDYSTRSQLEGHSDIIAKALETLSGRV